MNVYFLGEYIKKQREKSVREFANKSPFPDSKMEGKPQAGQESMHFYNVLGCRKTAII